MKWTSYDKSQVSNLIIALKKGKFEMSGMEILAFSDVFRWLSSLSDHIDKELSANNTALTPNSVKSLDSLTSKITEESKKKKK